jgi:hypothetical protein
LIAAIVRLMRDEICVVALTSLLCASRMRCGAPVANARSARRISRP